ncbi:MAG: hypothetical protein ACTSQF_08290 [Candidatus Heimdallarchaeaceae archaeon]
MRFSFRSKKKDTTDYLSLTFKDKSRRVGWFCLKWGGIILLVEIIIWILVDTITQTWFTEVAGIYFFTGIPALLMLIGGCMGGLSRYNIPPVMRIIEPDDQAVTPENFQIRVRYDKKKIVKETIQVLVNNKPLPDKMVESDAGIVTIPKIFKTPPTKAVSLIISVIGKDIRDKDAKDKIRVICDPESDEDDYLDYWEFKREDETYWGKEMISAQKHAKRNLNAGKLIALAVILFLMNYLLSLIYERILIAIYAGRYSILEFMFFF